MLFDAGIPYRYEHPVYLKGVGTVYPDFTILLVEERRILYWEHMGMMDDPSYCEKALLKINDYSKNDFLQGRDLILTHETSKHPLETGCIHRIIINILRPQ